MKKKILIILFIFISAFSYSQSFFDLNKNVSFGIQFGAVDQHNKEMGFQTLMFNISCYGVYLDIGGWPAQHSSDVRIDKWDDETVFVIHIGYQIPLIFAKSVKITPIIGYYNHQIGVTDGANWSVSQSGIHNKFIVEDELQGIDFGTNIEIDIKRFSIFGTFTKNMWYAGLGFNIPFNLDN